MINPPNNRSDFLLSHGRLKFGLTFTVNFFLAGLLEVCELLWRLLTTEVSHYFILRLFTPFHASLRHVQTCQLQKQTDPAKTGLVRYLVSNTHGSETCNCRVQRVFFFSLARITIGASPLTIAASLRKKKTLWHRGYPSIRITSLVQGPPAGLSVELSGGETITVFYTEINLV